MNYRERLNAETPEERQRLLDRAKHHCEEIVAKYPETGAAVKARQLLNTLEAL